MISYIDLDFVRFNNFTSGDKVHTSFEISLRLGRKAYLVLQYPLADSSAFITELPAVDPLTL